MREVVEAPKRSHISKVDKFISRISPSWACKRLQNKLRFEALSSLGDFYNPRRRSRNTSDFIDFNAQNDEDLLRDREKTVHKSIYLTEHNALASAIITTFVSNVIGNGFKPQSTLSAKSLGLSEDQLKEHQSALEKYFAEWSKEADATGYGSFNLIQALAYTQYIEYGECFAVFRKNDDNDLKIQLIDPRRVSTPTDLPDSVKAIDGIRIDKFGKPIGFYCKKHAKTFSTTLESYEYIEFKHKKDHITHTNAIHIFKRKRPGQYRGLPKISPVIDQFSDLEEYLRDELLKARVAATITALIESGTPSELSNAALRGLNDPAPVFNGERVEEISPGQIKYLNHGEKITQLGTNLPGGSFDPFVNKHLDLICGSIGLPVDLVLKNFKNSYSSSRAAQLEAQNLFKSEQKFFCEMFCSYVYPEVITHGYLSNEIPEVNFFEMYHEWTKHSWTCPGWEWIDKNKEVNAAKIGLEYNLMTLEDVYASKGQDWLEKVTQIAREKKTLSDLNLLAPNQDIKPEVVEDIEDEQE